LGIVVAVAKGERIAAVAFTVTLCCMGVLYALSVRAAREDRLNSLKRYMNIAAILITVAMFVFLTGK